MRNLKEIKKILIKNKKLLRKKYGIKNIRVFGSYAKGLEREGSDLDLIIEFDKTKSLIEIVKIEREISKLLGINVDLLTEKGISPYIINDIIKEAKYIFK